MRLAAALDMVLELFCPAGESKNIRAPTINTTITMAMYLKGPLNAAPMESTSSAKPPPDDDVSALASAANVDRTLFSEVAFAIAPVTASAANFAVIF